MLRIESISDPFADPGPGSLARELGWTPFVRFRHGKRQAICRSPGTRFGMVGSILQDAEGDLWLGRSRGLARFDPRTISRARPSLWARREDASCLVSYLEKDLEREMTRQ